MPRTVSDFGAPPPTPSKIDGAKLDAIKKAEGKPENADAKKALQMDWEVLAWTPLFKAAALS